MQIRCTLGGYWSHIHTKVKIELYLHTGLGGFAHMRMVYGNCVSEKCFCCRKQ